MSPDNWAPWVWFALAVLNVAMAARAYFAQAPVWLVALGVVTATICTAVGIAESRDE